MGEHLGEVVFRCVIETNKRTIRIEEEDWETFCDEVEATGFRLIPDFGSEEGVLDGRMPEAMERWKVAGEACRFLGVQATELNRDELLCALGAMGGHHQMMEENRKQLEDLG